MMTSKGLIYANRIRGQEYSVWTEFGELATKYDAINIGQGYPDFFPPSYVMDALKTVIDNPNRLTHQYARAFGHPRLVNALARLYSKVMGRDVDANEEVIITIGAYESLFCFHQSFIEPGDDVIIIEPFFDCYEPMIKSAGGVPVTVALKPTKVGEVMSSDDWKLDPEELARKFTQRTKAIIVNNPHNPVGKVFTLAELQMIADLCIKHDVIAVSDEVYEWMVYKPNQHIRIATLPGMWERTITVGSAGKTFSVTGWKIGWSVGSKHLIKGLCILHQNCTYTCPTPIQEAVAMTFETEFSRLGTSQSYWQQLPDELLIKRNKMAAILSEAGFIPTIPEGGYFMVADISKIKFEEDKTRSEPRDIQFVKWLTINKRLSTIPSSVFYTAEHKYLAENLIRVCFMKEDETLEKAAAVLGDWRKTSSRHDVM